MEAPALPAAVPEPPPQPHGDQDPHHVRRGWSVLVLLVWIRLLYVQRLDTQHIKTSSYEPHILYLHFIFNIFDVIDVVS